MSTRRTVEDWLYLVPEAVAAIDLFLLMVVVAVDVTGRYLFNKPLPAGYEMVQVMMGVLVFSAAPLLSRTNEHITVGLIDHLFRGGAHRARIFFVNLFSMLTLAFLTWRLAEHTRKLAMNGDATAVLNVPLAPVGYFATVLTGIAVLALAVLLARQAVVRQ